MWQYPKDIEIDRPITLGVYVYWVHVIQPQKQKVNSLLFQISDWNTKDLEGLEGLKINIYFLVVYPDKYDILISTEYDCN